MSIRIIALRYEEPYYADTLECIWGSGLPVTYADRQGVGNFSKAMNEAAMQPHQEEFLWFLTDVTFDPKTPLRLAENMGKHNLWALHPAHQSDHQSHIPDGSGEVKYVPYIEWTAPMVRTSLFHELGGLDENHHYWYQDLLFSKQLRDRGLYMGVDHGNPVGHIYRRNELVHEITKQRYDLRLKRDIIERELLRKRFGPRWRSVLWHQQRINFFWM